MIQQHPGKKPLSIFYRNVFSLMINVFCNFHDESVGEINYTLLPLYNSNLTALEMQAPI